MPLGAREMLLIIRARDVASRVVRDVTHSLTGLGAQGKLTGDQLLSAGAALTAVGVTLGAAGAAGLAFLNDATDSAIEYNRQAALTKTQVDDVSVSVTQLADIGRRVAGDIPAPFETMQAALYDIFSSMDVNVTEAEHLLKQFSKGAVAGQVDVQTAARSTISILNAFRLPITDVNRIMDIQFQLVRKGVGTYEEFNNALGRAIPAAVSAGQSVETLAGMMAFLTRNGLSTEMAATSAARAMELFSDPKRFKKLEKLGITVRDASGEFLQMGDIVTQLANNSGWAKMAEPQRKELFKEIFGQGTIQARRFFDTAIPNYKQLNDLTGTMYESAGALEGAYGTMFDEPASKAQLLANKYQILKTEIGDELIPIKLKLMEKVSKLIDWWNGLSESTQDLIIKIALFTSVALVAVGIVLTVVGAVVMLIGGIMLLGASLGGAILLIGAVVLGIAAAAAAVYAFVTGNKILIGILAALFLPITVIVGVIYLLITRFSELKEKAIETWHAVQDWTLNAWQTVQDFWDWVTANGTKIWHNIQKAASDAWKNIQQAASKVWDWFRQAYGWLDDKFGDGFRRIWKSASKAVGEVGQEIGETLSHLAEAFVEFWDNQVYPILSAFVEAVVTSWPVIAAAWAILQARAVLVFGIIKEVIGFALDTILTIIEFFVESFQIFWNRFGDIIIRVVTYAWDFIATVISSAITIISNIIQLVLNIIQGDWGEAWQNIKNIAGAAWNAIYGAILFVGRLIVEYFTRLPGAIVRALGDLLSLLYRKGKDIVQGLWNGAQAIWDLTLEWVRGLPGKVISLFAGAINWLYNAGKNILSGLWEGMKSKWNTVKDWVGSLGSKIIDLKGPPAKDRTLLVDNGRLIFEGLHQGMQEGWKEIDRFLRDASMQVDGFNAGSQGSIYGGTTQNGSSPVYVPQGPQYGMYIENLNVSDENVVNDLNWWYETRGAGV